MCVDSRFSTTAHWRVSHSWDCMSHICWAFFCFSFFSDGYVSIKYDILHQKSTRGANFSFLGVGVIFWDWKSQAAALAAALADGLVDPHGSSSSSARGNAGNGGASPANASGRGNRVTGGNTGSAASPRVGRDGPSGGGVDAGAQVGGSSAANSMLGVMMGGHKKQKPPGLRRGKWTPEEEKYANR